MLNLPFNKFHFIGIGGIGMSALAKLLLSHGCVLSGSSIENNDQVQLLQSRGVGISIGHDLANITSQVQAVIHSSAINESNPELKQARILNIPTYDYHEFLGIVSKLYKTIAIAGTHGKSTTTALVAKLLTDAQLDPTVIVGSKVEGFDGNFRLGESDYLVVEADEFNFGMLHLYPHLVVLNNIEADHLDCYKNLDNIIDSFKKFVAKIPDDGCLIFNGDDENVLKVVNQSAQYQLVNVNHQTGDYVYNFSDNCLIKINDQTFSHQLWGEYNDTNMAMAVSLAMHLGVNNETISQTLNKFTGIWRRFEVLTDNGFKKNITFISDYAHHPTALAGIIKASKKRYPTRKIWTIFQPHHYDRVSNFFADFVKAMSLADNPVLIRTYDVPGRETDGARLKTSADIAKELVNCVYLDNVDLIKDFVNKNVLNNEVVLAIGAGTIDAEIRKLISDK